MAVARISLDLLNCPRLIADLRREMANLLRREADGEPEFVRRKLFRCAEAFESGITEDPDG